MRRKVAWRWLQRRGLIQIGSTAARAVGEPESRSVRQRSCTSLSQPKEPSPCGARVSIGPKPVAASMGGKTDMSADGAEPFDAQRDRATDRFDELFRPMPNGA
jgi:hypothetical protein